MALTSSAPLDRILNLLQRVKQRSDGSHWDAQCPAHDDKHPSLSVGLGEDNRVLLKCHKGCSAESIVGALGLKMADLFENPDRPEIVAVYDYKDEAGILLFQTIRYYPKDFRQRRKPKPGDNGNIKGGWVWSIQGIPRVLYRLPELLASDPAEIVFICEGEKDVESVRRLGLVATCNPMGAKKWNRAYNEALRDRRVVILPHNDEDGREHARLVVSNLTGVAQSVCILELPGLAEKGDAYDWIFMGGTGEKLLALSLVAMRGAPPPLEAPPSREADQVMEVKVAADDVATIADLKKAGAAVTWLWEGWIPDGVLTAIAAPAGTGKTRLCADLLRRICTHQPWPNGQPMNLPPDTLSLWVMADNHHDQLVELSDQFKIEPAIRLNASKSDPYGGVSLQSAEDYLALEARIKAVRPKLVIIDTVGNATDRNLGRQEDAKVFYQPLQIFARKYRCAILCITHLNASGHFLGRRVMEKVRMALKLEQFDGEERLRFEVKKTAWKTPPALGVTMVDGANEYDTNPPESPREEDNPSPGRRKTGPPPVKLQECMGWVREQLLDGAMRVSALRDRAEIKGYDSKLLYRAVAALQLEQFVSEGRQWWSLREECEETK